MAKISHAVERDVFIGAFPNIKQVVSFVSSLFEFGWDGHIFNLQKVSRAMFRFLLRPDGRTEKQETQERDTQLPAHTPQATTPSGEGQGTRELEGYAPSANSFTLKNPEKNRSLLNLTANGPNLPHRTI